MTAIRCRALTRQETDRLAGELRRDDWWQRNLALFHTQLYTGLRAKEALALQVRHVYSYGRVSKVLYLERRYVKAQVEGFCFALHPRLASSLQTYIEWRIRRGHRLSPNGVLFISERGEGKGDYKPMRYEGWSQALKTAMRRAGVEGATGTHSLRKTFAQLVYEASGHDLKATQRALRHRFIHTTALYLHADDEMVNELILGLPDQGVRRDQDVLELLA